MEMWGNPDPVCMAGLFHAIYGTFHFRKKAWPIDQREVIKDLIGSEAERLAYVFCVAERPRVLLLQIGTAHHQVWDHHAKKAIRLSDEDFDKLIEIETANLLEQGGRINGSLERLYKGNISKGAKAAISNQLDLSLTSSPPAAASPAQYLRR